MPPASPFPSQPTECSLPPVEKKIISHFLRSCYSPPKSVHIIHPPTQKSFLASTFVCFRIVITVINKEAEKSVVLWLSVPYRTLPLVILEVLFIQESLFKCRHIIINAFSFSVITKKIISSLFLFVWWLLAPQLSTTTGERGDSKLINAPPVLYGGALCCRAQEFTYLREVAEDLRLTRLPTDDLEWGNF